LAVRPPLIETAGPGTDGGRLSQRLTNVSGLKSSKKKNVRLAKKPVPGERGVPQTADHFVTKKRDRTKEGGRRPKFPKKPEG